MSASLPEPESVDLFEAASEPHEAAKPLPRSPSVAAASQLSPAFPRRAPWGTASNLRAWQAEALALYHERSPRDFLAVATPGAGKTTFALRVATELLDAGIVRRVTVVAPTEHLKHQWADAAARVGIRIDPSFKNSQGRHGSHYDGVALTYAQVAAKPALHRARTQAARTLVILDEVHHGGDALSWGDAVRDAFEDATRRLALTGTPFRSDTASIPFVTYEADREGIRRSRADYTYGYGEALRDHVVRPVLFMTYSGEMRWRTRAGDEVAARLGDAMTKDMHAQAWRTALDPNGEWIPSVLAAADKRLTEVRRSVPDAGGLVIASDQTDARAYAGHLARVTGQSPTVVLSDDDGASARIDEFAAGTQRWMVAVRMVSEGVDVPRLAVGVYATSTSTPLFFAQAVGRFVRARKRGETASIFVPSVPLLLELANGMEIERDHALDRPQTAEEQGIEYDPEAALLAAANKEEKASGELTGSFEALEAQATFDRVLFDGGEFGTGGDIGSAAEQDFLGLPGLLDADQVTTLLRQHQAAQTSGRSGATASEAALEQSEQEHRRAAALRKELSKLVSAWARKSGRPHGSVHTELRRRCGGPEVPLATAAQLDERVEMVRGWFVGKK
ncbi:superfamily II DNA or RNA helicase [Isoptericola sp. CG 20/1183]|uniref:Superfamily II DNA or RNA helicase n=1 Tax=Isoptericola halotolerans TaxID=300560 RepID=A0ABX5EET2_9MICO|nr:MULTISPECIES: DEAD/DEAH box helicase [Isoptericola]MCK0117357.1 DEAD/DEAH box helicase [Isoptericola sp. S6320L]PRZ07655.1 superfamily II DNA or RNA helicase [Isoptericola halotolerans]PRZ07986.1 superfamily II DNA or RNA helicase [Isoptericola sp. CG 20/1183]